MITSIAIAATIACALGIWFNHIDNGPRSEAGALISEERRLVQDLDNATVADIARLVHYSEFLQRRLIHIGMYDEAEGLHQRTVQNQQRLVKEAYSDQCGV